MDLTEMNHREMLFQDRNLHWSVPDATQFVQNGDPRVHPACRGARDTDTSVARSASSNQASSNHVYPNMLCGCVDESIVAAPEIGHRNVREPSAPAYPFYADIVYHHTDVHNRACQSGTGPWQAPQMDVGISTTGESRENHRLWPTKAPQVGFPLALYMANANADAPSGALNYRESDMLYCHPALPRNQTQRYHDTSFQSGPEDYPHYGDPSPLALLPVHGAVPTVVPRGPSSSLRPTTTLVSCPRNGYDFSDINAVTANIRLTGSEMEIGDTISNQFIPMLNYHRAPAIQLSPLLPSEMMQHMSNGLNLTAGFEVSRNIGLGSKQIVWDLTTGDEVPRREKRSLSDAGRANSQIIRRLGGQCEKCKKNKRKCHISHLQPRSEASETSPSVRTCSSSESSFVLVLTDKRRKTDRLDVHAQRHDPSLEHLRVDSRQRSTHSMSGRSSSRGDRSESISSIAGMVGSANLPSSSESGTIESSIVELDNVNFSQDGSALGDQFRYGKSIPPQPTLRSKSG